MKNIPELQAWFKDLKVNHPDVWRQKVVSCRKDPNMPAGSSASEFYQSRGAHKVASFIQYATMSLTVQERVWVLHLKYRQYIAHKTFVQCLTDEEPDAKWNADLRDPSSKRTGTGENVELAVSMPRCTEAIRGKTVGSELKNELSLNSESDLALATKRMRFSALGRGITYEDFEDIGGGVFGSGASSSLRREEGPETFPTVASADAPPLALKASDVDLPWSHSGPLQRAIGNGTATPKDIVVAVFRGLKLTSPSQHGVHDALPTAKNRARP